MSAIYTKDPATGERVTLSELAKRHGVHVSTISRRYGEGKRGQALVDRVDMQAHLAELNAKAHEAAERRKAIILTSMNALSRPFKQLGGN